MAERERPIQSTIPNPMSPATNSVWRSIFEPPKKTTDSVHAANLECGGSTSLWIFGYPKSQRVVEPPHSKRGVPAIVQSGERPGRRFSDCGVQCTVYAGMVAEVVAGFENGSCPCHPGCDRPAICPRFSQAGTLATDAPPRLAGAECRPLPPRPGLFSVLLVSPAGPAGTTPCAACYGAGSLYRPDGQIFAWQSVGPVPAFQPRAQLHDPRRRRHPHILLRGLHHHALRSGVRRGLVWCAGRRVRFPGRRTHRSGNLDGLSWRRRRWDLRPPAGSLPACLGSGSRDWYPELAAGIPSARAAADASLPPSGCGGLANTSNELCHPGIDPDSRLLAHAGG